MKNKVVIILLIFLSLTFFKCNYENKTVQLKITTEFSEYIINQKIWVKFEVINNSNEDYYMEDPIDPVTVKLSIIDPDGNNWYNGVTVDREIILDDIIDSTKFLKRGERFIRYITAELYVPSTRYITGTHTIQGFYQDIESEIIEFDLKEPDDTETKAYKEYEYVIDNIGSHQKKYEYKINEYKLLINKYPSSVHVPNIYNALLISMSYIKSDLTDVEQITDEYLSNYSNRFETVNIIRSYIHYLERSLDKEDMNQKLSILTSKYPNVNMFINTLK